MKDSEKMLKMVKDGLSSSDHKKIYSKHFSETLALECNYCGSLVYPESYDKHLDECEYLPEDFEYVKED